MYLKINNQNNQLSKIEADKFNYVFHPKKHTFLTKINDKKVNLNIVGFTNKHELVCEYHGRNY